MEIFQLLHAPIFLHLSIISSLFLITWTYSLKGSWLIDDEEGIKPYSDSWQIEKDIRTGQIVREYKKDYYDYEIKDKKGEKKKVQWPNFKFNPHVGYPGSIVRWLRINLGKKFKVIGRDQRGHEVYGFQQESFRHHLFSLFIHFTNCILLYFLLSKLFDSNLAFWTVLLFMTHPVSAQVVAWISGIGYLLSLMFALVSFSIPLWVSNPWINVPLSTLATFLSMNCLLSGMANWTIHALLGNWWIALSNLIISVIGLLTQGREVHKIRTTNFKEQCMEKATKFDLRRPILMIKCVYYYLRMMVFPKRLGLFHSWGYHFEEKLSRIDWMFWGGIGCLIGAGLLLWFGPLAIKLGIVWLFIYLVLFLNLITAQQFVVDRYCFISLVGFCLLVAFSLIKWPILLALILGIYLMRTWAHLPTFKNLHDFYESNVKNFPNSEVALGNLAVTLINQGKPGAAMELCKEALKVNPFYDVPNYNLFVLYRGNGFLDEAEKHLRACLEAKLVHFPKQWTDDWNWLQREKYYRRRLTDSTILYKELTNDHY